MRTDLRDKLVGTIVPIVTPMHDDLSLKLESLPVHVEYLIEAGVRVIVPCGSTGEFASLSTRERKAVVKAAVDAAGGRAAVIAGASDTRISTVIELAHQAAEVGADGVLITPPYYFLPSEDEVFEFFAAIDKEIDLPLMFYNNPATTKFNASYALFERLAELKNFAAVKENNSQPVRYYEELKLFGERFPVVPAGEPPAIFNVLAGAPGFLSVAANFNPALINRMLTAAQEGRIDDAFAAFETLRGYRQLFEARNRLGYPMYVVYAKAAVNLIGIDVGPPRPPLKGLSNEELQRLREVLRKVMELEVVA